jgi:hypothetical protein
MAGLSISREAAAAPVFVAGYPGTLGGANTECWHTVRLWRQFGKHVVLLPNADPPDACRRRLDAIGCTTVSGAWPRLDDAPHLRGATVVAFCNVAFLRCADRFRDLGCRIVWVGCMNWMFPEERLHYRSRGPFDAYVFQSGYQQAELTPQLEKFGVVASQCHRIRGAMCVDEFAFAPRQHSAGTPLVVGRLSRPAPDKFSANTWSLYRRIPHPVLARVMGWNDEVARKVGGPPAWAECLPPDAVSVQVFLASLHCMIQINGGAEENWPRSGLEAMAAGVPIVAPNRWGWREMIRHGETGYLAETDDEVAYYAARLAYDEPHRLAMAGEARRVLEEELASPAALWQAWRPVLEPP